MCGFRENMSPSSLGVELGAPAGPACVTAEFTTADFQEAALI